MDITQSLNATLPENKHKGADYSVTVLPALKAINNYVKNPTTGQLKILSNMAAAIVNSENTLDVSDPSLFSIDAYNDLIASLKKIETVGRLDAYVDFNNGVKDINKLLASYNDILNSFKAFLNSVWSPEHISIDATGTATDRTTGKTVGSSELIPKFSQAISGTDGNYVKWYENNENAQHKRIHVLKEVKGYE